MPSSLAMGCAACAEPQPLIAAQTRIDASSEIFDMPSRWAQAAVPPS